MANVSGIIKNNGLLGNTLKLTAGSVINYLIPIVVTPILSRIFSPAEYGDWGVFSSIVTILTVFICGGYEFAIVESKSEDQKKSLSQLCLIVCLIFNFIILGVILVSDATGLKLIDFDQSYLIPVYLLFAGANAVLHNVSNARQQYKALAISQVMSGLVMAGVRIVLGLLKIHNGLVYGAIAALVVVVLYLSIKTNLKEILSHKSSSREYRDIIREYKNYPLFDAPSTFLVYLSNNIPILILGAHFGKEYVGCYTMVLHLLLLPMSFIGSNMSKVFFQQIAQKDADIKRFAESVFKLSFWLGLLVIAFFVFGGDYVLYKFLGSSWKIAKVYALYLSLWSFFTIMFAPLKPIYRVKKKQNVQVIIVLLSFLFQCGILLICSKTINDIGIVILIYSIVCSVFKVIEGAYLIRLCDSSRIWQNMVYISSSIMILLIWIVRILF